MPAWVGSVLSGLSVILALSIIIRDRRSKRRAHANEMAYGYDVVRKSRIADSSLTIDTVNYWFFNSSDKPYVNIRYGLYPHSGARLRRMLALEEWTSMFREAQEIAGAGDRRVNFYFKPGTGKAELRALLSWRGMGDTGRLLEPGGTTTVGVDVLLPHWLYTPRLYFTDGHNQQWQRNLRNGKLKSRDYGRVSAMRLWISDRRRMGLHYWFKP